MKCTFSLKVEAAHVLTVNPRPSGLILWGVIRINEARDSPKTHKKKRKIKNKQINNKFNNIDNADENRSIIKAFI
jgi:hypothetical protein